MAEQNYRKHGWPIPAHLRDIVAEIAPEIGHSRTVSNQAVDSSTEPAPAQVTERSIRIAAGQGKIEEVRIEPAENQDARTTKKERVRFGHNGKPWRPRNRRNSDDIKRDNMVEAILSEAKCTLPKSQPEL